MKVRQISCRQALVPSSLPGLNYAMNPYRGCSHGCAYCYAPNVLRETRDWGTFVDVRSDMPSVLRKDLKRKKRGTIGIGTVTDAYQPIEGRFRLTRACLIRLLDSPLHVSIQTKSALILRDLDVLSRLERLDVGVTITTLDNYKAKAIEPLASPPRQRLETIATLVDSGIETWAFVGPFLPGLDGGKVEELVREIHDTGASRIMGDRLRIRPDTLDRMRRASTHLLPEERAAFLKDLEDVSYTSRVEKALVEWCKRLGMEYEYAFPK